MSQALKKGWKLAADNNKIVISRNNCQIVFDIKIKTAKGVLFATKVERNPEFCGATNHIPHVHISLDISLRLSNRDNLQGYGKEFSST
jgi:hypothetical protein